MSTLVRFGVSVEEKLIEQFDRLIGEKGYNNRSEAIRDLMRRELVAEKWRVGNQETVGTLTVIYDHALTEVERQLTDMQHAEHGNVISSLHVHLDKARCLEVIVLRGKAKQLKRLADRLLSRKGVKHGQLVMTTKGEELV
jgi:CopG family nickel-responsive transcriptional regulator